MGNDLCELQNVPQGVDLDALPNHLDALESDQALHFETCQGP